MLPAGSTYALGAILALLAGALAVWGWGGRHPGIVRVATWSIRSSALVLAWATGRLAHAFWVSDFSLVSVVDHSRRDAPGPIRLAGLWGGMDGSLLLWTTLLAIALAWGMRVVRRVDDGTAARAILLSGLLIGGHAAIGFWLANPFTPLQIPAVRGGGLVPILEHPAMTVHPPVLYAGLVGLGPAFVWAMASLMARRAGGDQRAALPARTMRAMIIGPWVVLTVGVALGANWAYVELGWGGYWAWDPVENTSFIPWLAGLAAIHLGVHGSVDVQRWSAVAPFALVLIGSAASRSGAGSSVHAFADEPRIGVSLAVIAALALTPVLTTIPRAVRAVGESSRRTGERSPLPTLAAVLIWTLLIVVLVGTLRPVVGAIGGEDGLAVSGRFYAAMAGPVVVVGALAAGLATRRRTRVDARTLILGTVGLSLAGALAVLAGWPFLPTGVLIAVGGWLGLSSLRGLVSIAAARSVAHVGFAVLLVGIGGSTAATTMTTSVLPGDRFEFAGHEFVSSGVRTDSDRRRGRVIAELAVDDEPISPELVTFPDRGRVLAETALRSTWRDDVQIVLVRADDAGRAVIEVSVRPLVRWIWVGAGLIALGGLLALPRTRRRTAETA